MQTQPDAYYKARLAAGEITPDSAQEKISRALDELARRMPALARRAKFPRFIKWLFPRRAHQGLYIYGSVGRGKTMLMDMFFESVHGIPKQRLHFHAFMLDVQKRLHAAREDIQHGQDNVVTRVAADIARETRLLCFDEFQVHNIADAMILSRFFRELFRRGVVVVATSNTAPDNLYAGGLQRILFLPFIELIKKRLAILRLDDGRDYRQARIQGMPIYLTPLDAAARSGLEAIFDRLADHEAGRAMDIPVEQGRSLTIARAAHGVAWFDFDTLCRQAKGAADYLALAQNFHTVIIEGVPFLTEQERNAATRFINLVDVLYDHHIRVALSAEKPLAELLDKNSPLCALFERTQSRLMEMQSRDYLTRTAHRDSAAESP